MRDYLPPGSALSVPFIRRGPGAVTRLLRQPGAVGLASPLENSVLSQEEGEVSRTRAGSSGTQCLSGALRNSLRPTSPQAQKAVSCPPSSTLRRRTKPRWKPPQRLRALHSLAAFVSRNLFRPSARSAVLFLHSPHAESQVPRAGTPSLFRTPFSDPPRRRPPSFFGSRSRKDPKH